MFPRGFTVEEGALTAASPQTPRSGGNRLRASLGDLTRSACRPEAGQAVFIHDLRLHPHAVEPLKAASSLRFPFVFLLDFLLVVPDIEGHFGKKIKKI